MKWWKRLYSILMDLIYCFHLASSTWKLRRRIYTEEKAKIVTAVWGTTCIQILVALAIFHQEDFKNRMNLSFYSYHPGVIHAFLHIILVQLILFFISSLCNSSFSSYRPGPIHPFLHIILVEHNYTVAMSPKQQRRPLPSL